MQSKNIKNILFKARYLRIIYVTKKYYISSYFSIFVLLYFSICWSLFLYFYICLFYNLSISVFFNFLISLYLYFCIFAFSMFVFFLLCIKSCLFLYLQSTEFQLFNFYCHTCTKNWLSSLFLYLQSFNYLTSTVIPVLKTVYPACSCTCKVPII